MNPDYKYGLHDLHEVPFLYNTSLFNVGCTVYKWSCPGPCVPERLSVNESNVVASLDMSLCQES